MSCLHSKTHSAWQRWGSGICLAALLLTGCGGGGGGNETQESNDSPPNTTTTLQGFYQASAGPSNQEFISLILPNSSPTVQWYGWYFKGPNLNADPYLFSGTLELGQNGEARSSAAGVRAYTSGLLGTGFAHISSASATSFHASIAAIASQTAVEFNASSAPSSHYQLKGVPAAADLAFSWSGSWSSAGSSYSSTLTFMAQGGSAVLSANSSQWPCDVSGLSLTPLPDGNAFSASLVLPPRTGCSWTPSSAPQTLNGIALVHRVGSQHQLELMLLDSTGRGVSFRGNR